MKKKIDLHLYRAGNGYYTFVALSDMSAYGDILIAPTIPMEIEFDLYDEGTVRKKEIKSIDAQINEIREESLRKIIKLGERRQELMAIDHEPLP